MKYKSKSIRTFIGAKDFEVSSQFYRDLGFQEVPIDDSMSYFRVDDSLGFYLQRYYVKDWADNSMVFLEVDDLDLCIEDLKSRNLVEKYKGVRFTKIHDNDWGREIFMHDPSGVLWHFGEFYK